MKVLLIAAMLLLSLCSYSQDEDLESYSLNYSAQGKPVKPPHGGGGEDDDNTNVPFDDGVQYLVAGVLVLALVRGNIKKVSSL